MKCSCADSVQFHPISTDTPTSFLNGDKKISWFFLKIHVMVFCWSLYWTLVTGHNLHNNTKGLTASQKNSRRSGLYGPIISPGHFLISGEFARKKNSLSIFSSLVPHKFLNDLSCFLCLLFRVVQLVSQLVAY